MFQVLDLKESKMLWVTNHLGHTLDVHMQHFRATSQMIEKVEVAKLILIQHKNLVSRFAEKYLGEIQLEGKYSFPFVYLNDGPTAWKDFIFYCKQSKIQCNSYTFDIKCYLLLSDILGEYSKNDKDDALYISKARHGVFVV